MPASQQPPFAPNEFVYRWLSRTNSPAPEGQRSHLDATLSAHYEHANGGKKKIEQKSTPHSPSKTFFVTGGFPQIPKLTFVFCKAGKPERAHKSNNHHSSAKKVTVPRTDDPNEEEFASRNSRKRPRSGTGISEANEDASQRRAVSWLYGGVKSGSSCHSGLSISGRDSALPVTRVSAVGTRPEIKYERRPRHKTRPDKYELKLNKSTIGRSRHEMAQKKSKHKRRKKTGLALNRDFKAPNVPQDRLTLKPNTGPGLFHRGKASAPVEWRGLPDLTFSEMNFLAKRRFVGDTHHQRPKDVQPPRNQSSNASAQEINDFFSRPKQHDVVFHGPTARASSQPKVHMNSPILSNKRSPVKPGARQPLSLISGNENGARKFSPSGLSTGAQPEGWMLDPYVLAVQHCDHAARESFARRNQHSSPTSYSATSSAKIFLSADLHGQSGARQVVARPSSCEPRPSCPPRGHLPQITIPALDQGSISDRSLEYYTRHVPLGEDKQSMWDRITRGTGHRGHYTLQTLRCLAHLSELDDGNGSSAIRVNQHHDAGGLERTHIPLTDSAEHKHTLLTHPSSGEGLQASAARPAVSTAKTAIHREKGAAFVSDSSADPAAPVPQSGRQGLYAARPADHQPLRDSTGLGHIKITPDQVAWLLRTNPLAREAHDRSTSFGNVAQPGNPSPVPFGQTISSIRGLGLHHADAEPSMSASHSQRPPTAQARVQESIGHLKPHTTLDHLRIQHLDHKHDQWFSHGTIEDAYHQDYKNLLSEDHDDFDRALLHDSFKAAQLSLLAGGPAAGLSNVTLDLAPAYDGPTTAAQNHDRRNTATGLKDSEEAVAATRIGIDGVHTWGRRLGLEGGYEEVEIDFMGFARPHLLY